MLIHADVTSESAPSSVCNSPNHHAFTLSANNTQLQQPVYSSVSKSTARKQLSLNEAGHTNNLLVPEVKYGLVRRSSSPVPGTYPALPVYENIDNFDSAIPECERYLNNIGCQCAFDAEISQIIHVDASAEQQTYSKFYSSQSHPYQGARAVHRTGARPKQPNRSISAVDSSSNSSTPSPILSPVKYKDASTQHGGILHVRHYRHCMLYHLLETCTNV